MFKKESSEMFFRNWNTGVKMWYYVTIKPLDMAGQGDQIDKWLYSCPAMYFGSSTSSEGWMELVVCLVMRPGRPKKQASDKLTFQYFQYLSHNILIL